MSAVQQSPSSEPQVPFSEQQMPAPVEEAQIETGPTGLFKGIAVVIDDGVGESVDGAPDRIEGIIAAIKSAGGHAVVLNALPPEQDPLDGFSNAAFFIMDWNLKGKQCADLQGLRLGALQDEYERENVEFLKKLRLKRHAPVFIMTNESVDHVKDYLQQNGVMLPDSGDHIMVKHKSEVGKNLYEVLDAWLRETPSALLLKNWEQNQSQAMNVLFNEFHDKNKYWPVIFWNAYKKDGVSPQAELCELINRLVDGRMKELAVDLDGLTEKADEHFGSQEEEYKKSLHAVLQAERFLPGANLNPDEYTTGDLFEDPDSKGSFLINVRPVCDCVNRGSFSDGDLYMLRGKVVGEEALAKIVNEEAGNFIEKENEAIIFSLLDGKTVSFGFRRVIQKKFKTIKSKRIGRVLPPFLTKVTQRYAAYSHRPGLPRVPSALMPKAKEVVANPPAQIECECAQEVNMDRKQPS